MAKRKDDDTRSAIIGGGLLAGGIYESRTGKVHKKLRKIAASNTSSIIKDPENSKINRKLYREARKQKTVVAILPKEGKPGYINSLGITKQETAEDLKAARKEYRLAKKSGNQTRIERALDNLELVKQSNGAKDLIKTNPSAVSFSHELGHSKHFHNRGGSKVGKASHKLARKLEKISPKTTKVSVVGAGLISGLAAGKKEEKGEKESAINKALPSVPVITRYLPKLVAEEEASRQGIKILKKSGASKKFLNKSKKSMAQSFRTHLWPVVPAVAAGYGSREIGKVIGRNIERRKSNEKGKKNSSNS